MAKLDDLQHTDKCTYPWFPIEYWHEHDKCGDPECYVVECIDCGVWNTLCGMTEDEA